MQGLACASLVTLVSYGIAGVHQAGRWLSSAVFIIAIGAADNRVALTGYSLSQLPTLLAIVILIDKA